MPKQKTPWNQEVPAFAKAAALLVQGISIRETVKKTALSQNKILKVSRWLNHTPSGKQWADDWKANSQRIVERAETVRAIGPDPGVVSVTIHNGSVQITGGQHKAVWEKLKRMVDPYFG